MLASMNITAVLHDCSVDGETGYAATCAEFPEANGQGETTDAAIEDMRGAIRDILEYRRAEARRSLLTSDCIEVVTA